MEKAKAPHSSTLAWKIPWTEEPGRLQSMGSLRVGHNWATSLSLFTFMHWRRKWQPAPLFFLENPRDRGAWWAAVYGVAQNRTRLKQLSSSSRTLRLLDKVYVLLIKRDRAQGGGKQQKEKDIYSPFGEKGQTALILILHICIFNPSYLKYLCNCLQAIRLHSLKYSK